MSNLDHIDTIVVVMMENRSFDHLLGFLSHEAFDARSDVEGLHMHSASFDWDNADATGKLYPPTATPDGYLPCDLPHSRSQIEMQINQGAMDGFIKAYFGSQSIDHSPIPMRFCRPQDVPVTTALARGYSVCDQWFASVPADTQPNRLMAMSGYTLIDTTDNIRPPLHLLPDQTTVFDWLTKKGKSFEIYVDCPTIIADVRAPSNLLLMKIPMAPRERERVRVECAGRSMADAGGAERDLLRAILQRLRDSAGKPRQLQPCALAAGLRRRLLEACLRGADE